MHQFIDTDIKAKFNLERRLKEIIANASEITIDLSRNRGRYDQEKKQELAYKLADLSADYASLGNHMEFYRAMDGIKLSRGFDLTEFIWAYTHYDECSNGHYRYRS